MNSITEIWKDIPGTDEGYQASSLGRIRSTGKTFTYHPNKKPRILRLTVGKKNGYASLTLRDQGIKRREYVHVLVARTFLGPCPKGKEVNHKDGIRLRNVASNLEYMTRGENNTHSYRVLGRKAAPTYGEKHHNAKMTWALVDRMREEYKTVRCYARMAEKYKITWTSVRSIIQNETWKEEYRYVNVK